MSKWAQPAPRACFRPARVGGAPENIVPARTSPREQKSEPGAERPQRPRAPCRASPGPRGRANVSVRICGRAEIASKTIALIYLTITRIVESTTSFRSLTLPCFAPKGGLHPEKSLKSALEPPKRENWGLPACLGSPPTDGQGLPFWLRYVFNWPFPNILRYCTNRRFDPWKPSFRCIDARDQVPRRSARGRVAARRHAAIATPVGQQAASYYNHADEGREKPRSWRFWRTNGKPPPVILSDR